MNIPGRLWKIILSGCLLTALLFIFTREVYPAAHHTQRLEKQTRGIGLPGGAKGTFGTVSRVPFSARSNSHLFERLAESESEDDLQVENTGINSLFAVPVALTYPSLSDAKLSALPPAFFQCRATVPLFILYHSWKNFLSRA